MHALIIFLIFIFVVSILIFMINKDRNAINRLSKIIKDDSSTFEAKESAQLETKSYNKKVLRKSVLIIVLIILYLQK